MHSHCFADMFNLSKHFDRLAHRISHEAWNFFPSPMGLGRPYICRFPEGGGRGKWIDWSVTDAELFNQNPYIHRYPNHSRRRRLSHTYYLPRDDRWWMNWSENACMAFLYGKDTEYWYTTSAIDCFADARRINESRKWRGCLPVSAAKGRNEIFIILFFFFVLLYAGHQTASNGSFQRQGIFFFCGLRWNWNQRTLWIVRYDGDDLLAWRVFAEQCNRSGSFKPLVFQACTSQFSGKKIMTSRLITLTNLWNESFCFLGELMLSLR